MDLLVEYSCLLYDRFDEDVYLHVGNLACLAQIFFLSFVIC